MYDIIFVGDKQSKSFEELRRRFPLAKSAASLQEAVKKSFTKLFWVVWPDITIEPNFNFEYEVPEWDKQYVHVFKNGEYFDGVCLISKLSIPSEREFKHRFFVNKKEVDILASEPNPFEVLYIDTYKEYLTALETVTTDMFWCVWSDVTLLDTFKFTYQVPKYNQHITHIFKNGKFYDGICLFSKNLKVTQKEFEYRFFTTKKEIDIVASMPKTFDVVFISYFEKFADDNFQQLANKLAGHHNVYRINGVKGIHQAHRCAADLATTDLFWVVDADAIIKDDFAFDYQIAKFDSNAKRTVYVWRSSNPINDLEYGYGGVKLLPRQLTIDMDMSKPDMTTSISSSFKAMPEISNVTAFNTDAFSTWRSAFRECVKLSSNIIDRNQYQENAERLNAWLTYHPGKPFAQEAVEGAYDGREYGRKNAADPAALALINDFDWLKNRFEQTPPTSERFQQ